LIFCDTSALAKYYVPEAESAALASRLDSEDAVVVSELARVELMSISPALARANGRKNDFKWLHVSSVAMTHSNIGVGCR
jgi:predicted nucleic acid-binding protein